MQKFTERALRRLRRDSYTAWSDFRLWMSFRHLSGPAQWKQHEDDVTAVTLIRDGEYFLPELLRHHRAAGVSHFVFIDNGSSDGTLPLLASQADCTVIQSTLSPNVFESRMRRYAALRFCKVGWCLYVDTDELIEFPFGMRASDFARYLNKQQYTGVLGAMLDVFPEGDIKTQAGLSFPEAIAAFNRYDLADVERVPYFDKSGRLPFQWHLQRNAVDLPTPEIYYGGVRKRAFGEACCISKHPMIKVGADVEPSVHPHASSKLKCADVSLLIRHYKFAGSFLQRMRAVVDEGVWKHGEDVKRLAQLDGKVPFSLDAETARTLRAPAQLYDEGFLAASERFRQFAQSALEQRTLEQTALKQSTSAA